MGPIMYTHLQNYATGTSLLGGESSGAVAIVGRRVARTLTRRLGSATPAPLTVTGVLPPHTTSLYSLPLSRRPTQISLNSTEAVPS